MFRRVFNRISEELGISEPPFVSGLKKLINEDPAQWARVVKDASGPRILVATTLGGYNHAALVESILGIALTLRNARVDFLLCDEVLPACQLTKIINRSPDDLIHGGQSRRLCRLCHRTGEKTFGALDLQVHRLSSFVSQEERESAKRISMGIPLAELKQWRFDEIALGEHALAGALRYYAAGNLEVEKESTGIAQKYTEAALLTKFAMENLLRGHSYDVVCFHHGIYVPQGIIGEVCRKNDVRVVNWNPAYKKKTLIFSHGDTYHHTMMTEPTDSWSDINWNEERDQLIIDYLKSRRVAANDWIWFHEKPSEKDLAVVKTLGLDSSRPIVSLLTSVMWDAQLHYPNNAFPNMIDWVAKTIDYFKTRQDLQLVIRIHPAEVNGAIPSRQPMAQEIERRFSDLSKFPNIKIVAPEDSLSTYALTDVSDSVLIYNTKTGIELAAVGVPVIVAGEAWIRGKGFSWDAEDEIGYFKILSQLPFRKKMNPEQILRAKKYAYHFFFRRMIPLDFLSSKEKFVFDLEPIRLEDLKPGTQKGLDLICRGILEGIPFIYEEDDFKSIGLKIPDRKALGGDEVLIQPAESP